MKTWHGISIGAGILALAAGIIAFTPGSRRVLIAGDKPVTEEQVLAKLQSNGYSNVQISRDGHWFEVRAVKDGRRADLVIDAETGRLADEPFKDADEED